MAKITKMILQGKRVEHQAKKISQRKLSSWDSFRLSKRVKRRPISRRIRTHQTSNFTSKKRLIPFILIEAINQKVLEENT